MPIHFRMTVEEAVQRFVALSEPSALILIKSETVAEMLHQNYHQNQVFIAEQIRKWYSDLKWDSDLGNLWASKSGTLYRTSVSHQASDRYCLWAKDGGSLLALYRHDWDGHEMVKSRRKQQ